MMKIRKAAKKDLDTLVGLEHRLFKEHMNAHQVEFRLKKDFWAIHKKHLSAEIKRRKNVFFIAEMEGNPVGYIAGNIDEDPPVFMDRMKGRVTGFYVKEGLRRRGIGKALFAELKKWFKKRGIRSMRLFVAKSNSRAKRMYESLGFGPAQFEQLVLKM